MQKKKGICIDCGPGSKEQYLIAGRCESKHYWAHRRKVNANKPKNVAKQLQKNNNNVFFASQLLQAPKHCENCGDPLFNTISMFGPRSIICHIVPKRDKGGCPSVSLHPMNRWFGCVDCHNNYDNLGARYALTMAALPLIRERFDQFKNDIAPGEQKNIPSFLIAT